MAHRISYHDLNSQDSLPGSCLERLPPPSYPGKERLLYSTSPFQSIDSETLFNWEGSDPYFPERAMHFDHALPRGFHKYDAIAIVGSCNGLVCLEIFQGCGETILWNPLTGETNALPGFASGFCGFGFDPASGDYKVARGRTSAETRSTIIAVYSQKSHSWKEHKFPLASKRRLKIVGHGCYFRGSLLWLDIHLDKDEYLDLSKTNILEFDLSTDKLVCHMAPFSRDMLADTTFRNTLVQLGSIDDRLSLCFFPEDAVTVFVKKEVGPMFPWYKMVHIPRVGSGIPRNVFEIKPLSFSFDGRLLMLWDQRKFAVYDPNKGGCTVVLKSNATTAFGDAVTYQVTSVSPVTGRDRRLSTL